MSYTLDFRDGLTWTKARASGDQGGSCAYVAHRADGMVGIRDGKAGPAGAALWFTPTEWRAFLDGAKAGEFDL